VISSPRSLYRETLPILADLIDSGVPGAEPLGVHLEGPFVNAKRRGAHPEAHISPPDDALLNELLGLAPVRLLTLAPELVGAVDLARAATERGVAVSAGIRTLPSRSPTELSTARWRASPIYSTG
jgi:N-acetylglucosamine-6-phosphate deacetylase